MVAAHTDSPCFKLKPKSKLQQNGFVQVRARVCVPIVVAIDQHKRNFQLLGGFEVAVKSYIHRQFDFVLRFPPQIGVECYGGGLWYTWFDRDLSVAGRVIVANADNSAFESKLVRCLHKRFKAEEFLPFILQPVFTESVHLF